MNLLFPFRSWRMLLARGAVYGMITLGACSVMGQAAGPVVATPGLSAASGALGALILSPAQRHKLETLRGKVGDPDGGGQVLPTDRSLNDSPGLPDTLVVSGVVTRSGNRSTVWINDQPLYGRAASDPLRTLAGQAGVLQPRAKDMQLKARPGQVIDVPSGQAVDLLPPGAIRIIPPKVGAGGTTRKE